jgi:hypothetical protein
MMAEVNKLQSNIGSCIFKGTDRSRLRQREKDDNMMTFTDTVRLHPADNSGEDFTLVATVCRSVGRIISGRKNGPVQDLEELLEDRVFNGMKASNWRREEEATGKSIGTSAVEVFFDDGNDDGDCEVQVMLGFESGRQFLAEVYLS